MAQLSNTSLFNDANLISYYKLEDTSDSKGANTLTNNNSVTFTAAKYNNGADMGSSNTNKYLSQGNLGIAGNTPMSIVGWVKLNTEITSGVWTLFDHQTTTTLARYIEINYNYNGGTIRLEATGSGGQVNFNIALGTATFHHLGIVRDASNVYLYVDGVQQGSTALGSNTTSLNVFGIGATGNGLSFSSAIYDDAAVLNRALTQSEVSMLFSGGGGFFNLVI